MRLEYVVVGFILALIVLVVAISMLTGIAPSMDSLFNMFRGKI